jgi:hypothetical protein
MGVKFDCFFLRGVQVNKEIRSTTFTLLPKKKNKKRITSEIESALTVLRSCDHRLAPRKRRMRDQLAHGTRGLCLYAGCEINDRGHLHSPFYFQKKRKKDGITPKRERIGRVAEDDQTAETPTQQHFACVALRGEIKHELRGSRVFTCVRAVRCGAKLPL